MPFHSCSRDDEAQAAIKTLKPKGWDTLSKNKETSLYLSGETNARKGGSQVWLESLPEGAGNYTPSQHDYCSILTRDYRAHLTPF